MRERDHDTERQGVELGAFLRAWRERLDHTRVPGIDSTRRRTKSGLTQRDVATLTNVSLTWYQELERGEPRRFSEDFLQRLANLLRLDKTERAVLFHLALGHPPPPTRPATNDTAGQDLRLVLDRMLPHPAFVLNQSWDVTGFNAAYAKWFPWIAAGSEAERANVMVSLFSPEAREYLVNWREDWALPALARLRYALALQPHNDTLARLCDDLLDRSEGARELWRTQVSCAHPDQRNRRMRHPEQPEKIMTIRALAFLPLAAPGSRLIVMLAENSTHG